MFPNVRRLVCKTDDPINTSLWLFMGPQLRSIVLLSLTTTSEGLERTLETLVEKCPLVEDINLGALSHDDTPYFHSLILRLVTACANLRILEIPTLPLHPTTVKSIASLPNLEILRWGGVETNSLESMPQCFPRLSHYIQLEPADITSYISLVGRIASKRLEVFDIQCRPSRSSELQQLFTTLHDRFHHDGLTYIGLRQLYGQLNESCIADISCITPLLSFHNLRNLFLLEACVLKFYDQDLAAMAANWPRLEKLVLNISGNGRGWVTPYTITPRGFFALIRGCPELLQVSLHLTFVAEDLEDQIREMETAKGCPNLHSLAVGDARIVYPEPVAVLFCRLFPRLAKVVDSSPTRGGWEVVSLALRKQRLASIQ
jgi:hypothetical protein